MRSTLSGNFQEVTQGVFRLNNNTWGVGDRINGTDFTQTISYDPADLTRDVQMDWAHDDNPDGNILAYPEIAFGFKPWSQDGPDFMVTKVSDLRELEITTDIDISGQTGGFNVAYDLWLTGTPKGGAGDITTEVMVWTHKGDFGAGDKSVATYTTADYTAQVYTTDGFTSGDIATWRYVAVVIDGDRLDGTIDMDAILRFLVQKGLVSGDDYLTGVELGAEVQKGSGSMDINSLDYTFGGYKITNGADSLIGTDEGDVIGGRNGNDTIRGADGADDLTGGTGRDWLVGGRGSDALDGGAGIDSLQGGAGDDRLTGGAGADRFIWYYASKGDAITDFAPSQGDRIDLRALDANTTRAGNQAFDFIGAAAFTGHKGDLRAVISGNETQITADIDGDRRADMQITLDDAVTLQSGDFLL
jgi:Ca2+-binding RTX toxin-like protein